jgi:hypothetical protein
MAQQTRRSNGKKSTRKPAQRKASSARKKPAVQDTGITAGDIWNMFKDSRFFAPVITILAVFLIIGLDLLFSWNNFELFFKILGVELILAFAVWIINLMVSLGRDKKNTDSYSDEV